MGVLGLWKIIDAVGHPIKVDGLEGKRLGVDANLWLYKYLRGFREKDNATYNIESHKLGLFNRIAKLLYYRIKPVFVFDGPAPVLKRRTLERRQNTRNKHVKKVQDAAMRALAQQIREQYPDVDVNELKVNVPALTSHNLVAAEKLTDEDRELFYLPPETITLEESDTDEDYTSDEDFAPCGIDVKPKRQELRREDIVGSDDEDVFSTKRRKKYSMSSHGIKDVDVDSAEFQTLPAEVRYEILQDIKESRRRIKQNDPLPEDPESFSSFQLQRLKARRSIQEKIERSEKDICSTYTGECGDKSVQSYRVQSDATSNMLYFSKRASSSQQPTSSRMDADETSKPSNEAPRQIYLDMPQEDQNLECMTKKVTTKIIDDAKELLRPWDVPSIEAAGEALAQQIREQDPDVDVNELKVNVPALTSHNLVAAEKLTDEDRELFYLPPETITLEESDTDEDYTSDEDFAPCGIDVKPKRQELRREDIVGSDDEDVFSTKRRKKYSMSSHGIKDVDVDSAEFQTLPAEVRYEILQGIKESRRRIKQNDPLPEDPKSFSSFQSQRLKARRSIQEKIERSEKDICSAYTGGCGDKSVQSYRVQSDATSNVLYSSKRACSSQQPTSSRMDADETSKPSNEAPRQIYLDMPQEDQNLKRMTKKVTTKIIDDAKELLRLWGVPYIDAAGEAEAQCALLEKLKLTDGTITDDSDVWLFGAQNVYRHFFNEDKYLLQYKMNDIEFHCRMTRENLVCFAMLVGSDYTDGIVNAGPVTAVEILSEFPGDGLEPLIKFKKFHDKYRKFKDRIPGSKKREKFLRLDLPEDFPSRAVYEGYLRPMADSSEDRFTWGTPELDELREYARKNFGWNEKKIDDTLLPVMKRLSEKRIQSTIDKFFFKRPEQQNPDLFRSKRMNEALNKITSRASQESVDTINLSEDSDDSQEVPKPKRTPTKTTKATSKRGAAKTTRKTRQAPKRSTTRRKNVKEDDVAAVETGPSLSSDSDPEIVASISVPSADVAMRGKAITTARSSKR